MHRAAAITLLAVGCAWLAPARAQEPTPPPVGGCAIPPLPELEPLAPDADQDTIDVQTGQAGFQIGGLANFADRVRLRRGDVSVSADGAVYDQASGTFAISGDVEFRDPTTLIRGRSAEYDAAAGTLAIEGTEFDLLELPARGAAGELRVEGASQVKLRRVSYTSCARGKDDWLLTAREIRVNRESGMATARNARLDFMGVPILYAPYLTYPVTGQRKSGLLLPEIGNSSQRGVDVLVPYYLNLAPNYDATLTPRFMSRRGLQAAGEFRYLTARHDGKLYGEFLPNDDVTGENRELVSFYNRSALPRGWRATLEGTDVSDTTYFEDLSGSLAAASQTHLWRHADLELYNQVWSVLLRFEDYQTLDEAIVPEDEPYRRVPRLAATAIWPRGPLGLEYGLLSDISYFDRDVGVTGLRATFRPEVTLPLEYRGIYLRPNVALDYTRYSLSDTEPGADDSPDRTVPIYSVDLGAVFERSAGAGGRWLQTLEPRTQFVYIPFEDQSALPVFDTIVPDFNLVQLFRTNRYVGYDRLSDTEQLSIGITSRLIRASDGAQLLTATLGQALYFSDQEVVLPGNDPSQDDSSDYIAELGMNLYDRWKLDLGYQWDADESESTLAEARVAYNPDQLRVVNIAYRYRRDVLEEIDIAAAWPLGNRWSAVGRYDYSIQDSEPLERFLGLEYATCCWAIRTVLRRYVASRTGESETAFTVQLQLKGFSSTSSPAERLLDRGILGYDRY